MAEEVVRDLKDSLKTKLTENGALSEIRARIRSEVFQLLKEEDGRKPPTLSNENLIINELIKEYLSFNGFKYTESVLIAETGQPELADKDFLQQQLYVKPIKESAKVPLLYGMVSYFAKQKGVTSVSPASVLHAKHEHSSPPEKLHK